MQTTVADNLTPAIAGMPAGQPERVSTYLDSAQAQAKVVDIAITEQDSTAYSFLVGGVPINFTSDASGTKAEIRDGLLAALAAAAAAYPNSGPAKVAGSASGDDVRITELLPQDGEVPVSESDSNLALSSVTAHAQQEPLRPGIVVVEPASGGSAALGTTPQCRLPRGTGKVPVGVTLHKHRGKALSALDADAVYDPGEPVDVHWGPTIVQVEDAVIQGAVPYFRHTASGLNTVLGKVRSDDDSSTADALTGWRFKTGASAGGLAIIEPR